MPNIYANRQEKRDFLEEIMEALGERQPYQRPSGGDNSVDVHYSTKLFKYFEPQLKSVDQYLQSLSQRSSFKMGANRGRLTTLAGLGKPDTYSVIDQAFSKAKRFKMLANLAADMAYYVWQYDLGTKDNTNHGLARRVRDFGNGASWAKHAVDTLTKHFKHNIELICTRALQDWEDIQALFFQARPGKPDLNMLKLDKISIGDSDPHKGAKKVCFLIFEVEPVAAQGAPLPQGQQVAPVAALGVGLAQQHVNVLNHAPALFERVVYKPADLELDMRFVGDTAMLRQQLPHRINDANPVLKLPDTTAGGGSLFEVLNQYVCNQENLQLATYRILPRRCGSQMVPAQDHYCRFTRRMAISSF